jgi:hypothetical protein
MLIKVAPELPVEEVQMRDLREGTRMPVRIGPAIVNTERAAPATPLHVDGQQ